MAELPLVEGMRRVLAPRITGKQIVTASVLRADRIAWPEAEKLPDLLCGQHISGMERCGKFIGVQLGAGRLWFHLRMNGALSLEDWKRPVRPHTHLRLMLEDGQELRFRDPRCFALAWYISENEEDTRTGLHRLGPDALTGDWDDAYLAGSMRGRRKTVKACLLDQTLLAGIGNIYADEILFHAKIRPDRPAGSLTPTEIHILGMCIRGDLEEAAQYLSIPPERYFGLPYRPARHAPRNAYGRSRQNCRRCGSPLVTDRIAGRRTVYCPACQK